MPGCIVYFLYLHSLSKTVLVLLACVETFWILVPEKKNVWFVGKVEGFFVCLFVLWVFLMHLCEVDIQTEFTSLKYKTPARADSF